MKLACHHFLRISSFTSSRYHSSWMEDLTSSLWSIPCAFHLAFAALWSLLSLEGEKLRVVTRWTQGVKNVFLDPKVLDSGMIALSKAVDVVRENNVICPILKVVMFKEYMHQINVFFHVPSALVFVIARRHSSLPVDVEFSAAALHIVHLFYFR